MVKIKYYPVIFLLFLFIHSILTIQESKANTNQNISEHSSMINGMWEVESVIKGKKNTGIAYIFNVAGNKVKGYVKLKRLPVMLKLVGTIHGSNIDITAESQKIKLSSTATLNPQKETVSGSYISSQNNMQVKWTGKKINAIIKKGTYKYNKKSKHLFLKLRDGTSPEYSVLRITPTSLIFKSGQEWKRSAANTASISGVWETRINNKQYVMVLCDDKTVNFIIRDKYNAPPAKDMSGLWYVSSLQNGVLKTGRAFICMASSGLVSGFAETTSLPGLSTIIGKMSDLEFTLTLRSPKGKMAVEGYANNYSSVVSGSFHLDAVNKNISWAGNKISRSFKIGRYSFDQQAKTLTTFFENNHLKKYQIKTISVKQMVFIDATIWKRNAGNTDSVIGAWEHSINDSHQFFVFFKNKKLMVLDL